MQLQTDIYTMLYKKTASPPFWLSKSESDFESDSKSLSDFESDWTFVVLWHLQFVMICESLCFWEQKHNQFKAKLWIIFALFIIAITISQRIIFKSLVNSSVEPWQDVTSVKSSHKLSGY